MKHLFRNSDGYKVWKSILENRVVHALAVMAVTLTAVGGVYLAASPGNQIAELSPEKFPEPVLLSDEFQVIQAVPQGELNSIADSSEITVIFSDPMVPLETLADEQEIKAPIRISGGGSGIKGRFRWYGSRAAAFIPESLFPPGTEVTVTVPSGTKSLNGKELKKEYKFSFRTPEVQVTSLNPGNYSRIAYNPEFSAAFNYEINEDEVREILSLKVQGKEWDYTLRKGKESWEKLTWFIRPAQKFPRDAEVAFMFRKGRGLKEGWGSNAQFVSERKYRTYGPLNASVEGEAAFYQELWNRSIKFSSPVSVSEILKYLEISPAAEFTGYESESVDEISLNSFALKPGSVYNFRLKKGMSDRFGNTLKDGLTWQENVPSLRREFDSLDLFGIMESADPKPVPLTASGTESVKVAAGIFSLENLISYNASSDYRETMSYTPGDSKEWKTGLNQNTRGLIGFPLKKFSPEDYSWKALAFTASVHNDQNQLENKTSERFVVTTDMGVTVRHGSEKVHAYIHSFSTGKSLSDIQVDVYNVKQKIGSCRTDASGYCAVKHSGIKDPSRILVYAENRNGDRSFAAGKLHNMYMWSVSPNYDASGSSALTGQIVFDRKLYRPGDTVQYKALLALRSNGKLTVPSGRVNVKITDSNSRELQNLKLTPSAEGGVWGEIRTEEGAPLGHYTVTVTTEDKKYTISDTFQVEEFRPVSFTVSSDGFEDSVKEKDLKVSIEGRYLFGAPMSKAPVTYSINRKPLNLHFSNYPEYFFGDEDYADRWDPPSYSQWTSGSGNLSDTGRFTFSEKLSAFPPENLQSENVSRTYELELEATVSDADERTVTHRRYMKVYPGNVIPGIYVKSRYQNYGESFVFNLAAVSQKGVPVAEPREMTVIISRKEWKTIESYGPGGAVQRENTLIVTEAERKNITSGPEPVSYSFKAVEPGIYTFLLKDNETGAYSRVEFFASGGGFIGWDFANDDTISVLPDRQSYKPGDTAKILIRSPFERCRAIVSVERDDIIWQKTFDLEGNGEPISVPITEKHLPNVYVTVLLIRPRTQVPKGSSSEDSDPGRPVFRMGVARLDVSQESKRLTLKAETDKKIYLPAEEVKLTLRTEPGAEVAVSVADRAVLDLIDYRFADPLKTFYSNWPHGTGILDNRQSVIQRLSYANKGQEPGGKGWESAMMPGRGGFSDDSEDGVRKEFRYTAYWNAAVKADENGTAVIKFRLPHNLTTFRVQAVAAKQGKYASAFHEFKVNIPVVLQTSLPLLLRKGDTFTAGAVIINQTGRDGEFIVKLNSPDLSLTESGSIRLYIKSNESREAAFTFRLKDTFQGLSGEVKGELSVSPADPAAFRTSGFSEKQLGDRVRFTLPVKEHPPAEAFTVAGFTDTAAEEKVKLPPQDSILNSSGSLDLSLSATALTGIDGAVHFFSVNPYYCLEQRASAYLVSLAASGLVSEDEMRKRTQAGFNLAETENLFVKEIKKFQNPDGGMRLWEHSSGKSDPYLTAYTAFVIQKIQEIHRTTGKGVHPGALVYSDAVRYLRNYISSPEKTGQTYILETLALTAYVLSKDGEGDRNLEAMLYKKREFLSLRARANLMMAMGTTRGVTDYKKDTEIKTLMDSVNAAMNINTQRVSFRDSAGSSLYRSFYSRGSVLGSVIAAYTEVNPGDPLLPLMARHAASASLGLWGDSHSAGILAAALLQYRIKYEKPGETGAWTVKAGDRIPGWNASFAKNDQSVLRKSYPLSALQKVYEAGEMWPLSFRKDSGGTPLYYTAVLRYSPSHKNLKPRDEGMEVQREVLTYAGTVHKGAFRRGEMYRVRLTVINPKPVHHFLLTDPVPAGFEAVNTSFITEKPSASREIEEEAADSDFWWFSQSYTSEYRTGLTVFTQEYLEPGMHRYEYLIRPLVKGSFYYAAASASGMYEPEIFGRSAGYQVSAE